MRGKVTIDLTGQKFGRLIVLKRASNKLMPSGQQRIRWRCLCECGKIVTVGGQNIKSGETKSCGCWNRDRLFKHGQSLTPEHAAWSGMKARCLNPKNSAYNYYGGRGITVCGRWQDKNGYLNFIADMGLRPTSQHSLDRINVNGNYEPTNCRWATKEQQMENRRPYKCIEEFSNEELQKELQRRIPEYGLSQC